MTSSDRFARELVASWSPRLPARILTWAGSLLLAAWMMVGCSSNDPVISTGSWMSDYSGFEVHVTDINAVPAANVPVEVKVMDRFIAAAHHTYSGVTDGQGRFRRPFVSVPNIYGGGAGYHSPLEISVGPPPGGTGEPVFVLDSLKFVESPGQVVVSTFKVVIP
jgi:hypothetical protein